MLGIESELGPFSQIKSRISTHCSEAYNSGDPECPECEITFTKSPEFWLNVNHPEYIQDLQTFTHYTNFVAFLGWKKMLLTEEERENCSSCTH